ncbi:MAG: glycerophosphodiester phosphodiesterase, partial [Acidimicrobiales bacterium]
MTAVLAHRGLHRAERENTLAAFAAARAAGADGVELDVHASADGVAVVHHDSSLAGRALGSTPASELPDYVPTLGAALEACAGLWVNVEVKSPAGASAGSPGMAHDLASLVVGVVAGATALG